MKISNSEDLLLLIGHSDSIHLLLAVSAKTRAACLSCIIIPGPNITNQHSPFADLDYPSALLVSAVTDVGTGQAREHAVRSEFFEIRGT